MASPKAFIVTPYFFDKSREQDYDRLLRSLRASERELDGRGQIILIANGTEEGAEDPSIVAADALPANSPIVPIRLRRNSRIVGGTNAGFKAAHALSTSSDDLICSVQSSAVLQPGWVSAVIDVAQEKEFFGVATRLIVEEQPHYVRSDGHCLVGHCTYDRSFLRKVNDPTFIEKKCKPQCEVIFPCLSACAYRAELVGAILERYGNFVSRFISRNGDCTDIAMRAFHAIEGSCFAFAADAVATKRWSKQDEVAEIACQLMLADLHFRPSQRQQARQRVAGKVGFDVLLQAEEEADRMVAIRRASEPYTSADVIQCKT